MIKAIETRYKGFRSDPIASFTPDDSVSFSKGFVYFPNTTGLVTLLIRGAFNADRSARFEHGESGVRS